MCKMLLGHQLNHPKTHNGNGVHELHAIHGQDMQ